MRYESLRSFQQILTDNIVIKAAAPVALTGASNTISAAGIIGGIITINGGTAGAVTSTLVTAALLDTALTTQFTFFPIDYGIVFSVINISTVGAEDATVTTATGWTLVGNMVVASNAAATDMSAAQFLARKTAPSTFTLYRLS